MRGGGGKEKKRRGRKRVRDSKRSVEEGGQSPVE